MIDEPETLQTLEESGSEALGTLSTVVAWLHQEGFYAAESALLSEVEIKYPDQTNSRVTQSNWEQDQTYPSSTQGSLPQEDIVNLGATSCILEEPCPEDAPSSAERWGVFPASTLIQSDLFEKVKFILTVCYIFNYLQGGRGMEK
jgi:hypothetical protein